MTATIPVIGTFFRDANPDGVVVCLSPPCQGPDRPARYPPVTAAHSLRSRLGATCIPQARG